MIIHFMIHSIANRTVGTLDNDECSIREAMVEIFGRK